MNEIISFYKYFNVMIIEKIRRANLEKYIALNYKNRRKFSMKYGINYGNLYSILKGDRPFGERLARDLEEKLELELGTLDHIDSNLTEQPVTKIAIYENKLSAGSGNKIFAEEVIGYHMFASDDLKNEGLDKKNLCIFFVRGDSMLPEIQDGAKVLIDISQRELVNNKIYAVSVNNEIFIKKLFQDKNQIILRSENHDYKDKIYKTTDELNVIGRAVYILGKRL